MLSVIDIFTKGAWAIAVLNKPDLSKKFLKLVVLMVLEQPLETTRR